MNPSAKYYKVARFQKDAKSALLHGCFALIGTLQVNIGRLDTPKQTTDIMQGLHSEEKSKQTHNLDANNLYGWAFTAKLLPTIVNGGGWF